MTPAAAGYRPASINTSTTYNPDGFVTDEEVRVHLEHTDTHRRFAVVFGRSAHTRTPNRVSVRSLHTFYDVEGKEATDAISAALIAIRNHHGNITNPVTLVDCPRCEGGARRLTERIRIVLDRVSTAWADLAERITEAYQRRADLALGYGSWAEYAEAELRPSEGIAPLRRADRRLQPHPHRQAPHPPQRRLTHPKRKNSEMTPAAAGYRPASINTSTTYNPDGFVTDEEVRVHLEHTDTHRRFAVVFGRSAHTRTPNRVSVRSLHTFYDVEGKEATDAISAALIAIRNHHGNITNPVTLVDCPRCEGGGDLGDVEAGRPCPTCEGTGKCSPDDATDWINATLAAGVANWGTREDVPA